MKHLCLLRALKKRLTKLLVIVKYYHISGRIGMIGPHRMREFQVRILAEVIFFTINSISDLEGMELISTKNRFDFKLVIYCV